MSEVIQENSGFTSEGSSDYRPSLYADNLRTKELGDESIWTDEILAQRAQEYNTFLNRTDLMPRARADAERFTSHMLHEMLYRLRESLEPRHG